MKLTRVDDPGFTRMGQYKESCRDGGSKRFNGLFFLLKGLFRSGSSKSAVGGSGKKHVFISREHFYNKNKA